MNITDTITALQPIAQKLREHPRIQAVYLEYPAHLSVVIEEDTENFVYFGFLPDEDEQTELAQMSWNDITGQYYDTFDTLATSQANADKLIEQLTRQGLLN